MIRPGLRPRASPRSSRATTSPCEWSRLDALLSATTGPVATISAGEPADLAARPSRAARRGSVSAFRAATGGSAAPTAAAASAELVRPTWSARWGSAPPIRAPPAPRARPACATAACHKAAAPGVLQDRDAATTTSATAVRARFVRRMLVRSRTRGLREQWPFAPRRQGRTRCRAVLGWWLAEGPSAPRRPHGRQAMTSLQQRRAWIGWAPSWRSIATGSLQQLLSQGIAKCRKVGGIKA